MKKAPVYKTGQHKTNADAGLQNRPTCRPELRSGEMKKAPVCKTGRHKTNADAGL
jgi:hypothetical protein